MTSSELKAVSRKYEQKLKKIKVALFDVDGILTDGKVYYSGEEMGFNRSYHVRDGYGMKILMKAGIKVGVITGGNSLSVIKRFKDNLPVDYFYYGSENKLGAWQEILNDGFENEELLYMGDEFFDIPLLKKSGFSATVSEASPEVQESVDYICTRPSGLGCVREVIDMLRFAQGIVPKV